MGVRKAVGRVMDIRLGGADMFKTRQDYARFELPDDYDPYENAVGTCEECDAPLHAGDKAYDVGECYFCGSDCLVRGMEMTKITLRG